MFLHDVDDAKNMNQLLNMELNWDLDTLTNDELIQRIELFLENHHNDASENLLSLTELMQVQVLLELGVNRILYPYLILCEIFGSISYNQHSSSNIQDIMTAWFDMRQPSNAHKLRPTQIFPLSFKFEGEKSHSELLLFINVLEKCIVHIRLSAFVQNKYLADIVLYRAVADNPTPWQPEEVSFQEYISSMLKALRIQSNAKRILSFVNTSSAEKLVRQRVGSELSASVVKDGGVAAIFYEMLSHVPPGNTQAYEKVAGLLITNKGKLDKVIAQLLKLLEVSEITRDKEQGAMLRQAVVISINAIGKRYGPAPLTQHVTESILGMLSGAEAGISQGIRRFKVLLDTAPPHANLIDATSPLIPTVFELYAFCSEFRGRLTVETREVLLLWMRHATKSVASMIIRACCANMDTLGKCGLHVIKLENGGPVMVPDTNDTVSCVAARDVLVKPPSSRVHINTFKDAKTAHAEIEETEDWNLSRRCSWAISVIRHRMEHLQAELFEQSIRGISLFLASGADKEPEQTIADVLIIQYLLDGNFVLGNDHMNARQVTECVRLLLEGCASSLRLWTLEDKEVSKATNNAVAVFALQICPLALALASALIDINDPTFWPTDGTRYGILQSLMEPLGALCRADVNTARSVVESVAVGEIEKPLDHYTQVCTEIAQGALSIKLAILMSNVVDLNNQENEFIVKPEENQSDIFDPIGDKIRNTKLQMQTQDAVQKVVALESLGELLKQTRPEPRPAHVDEAVAIFVSCLLDRDSYVFLSSIRIFTEVAERRLNTMIPRVLEIFGGSKKQMIPLVARLRLGEIMTLLIRRSGEMLYHFAKPLIRIFVAGASVRRSLTVSKHEHPVDDEGRYLSRPVEGTPVKSTVQSFTELEQLFRASCLSNLAEICTVAPIAAFDEITDILSLVRGILELERDSTTVEVRRTAAYVLRQLVEGALLTNRDYAMNRVPQELRELHQMANASSTFDKDEIVRLHVDIARGRYDELMHRFIDTSTSEKVLKVSIGTELLK